MWSEDFYRHMLSRASGTNKLTKLLRDDDKELAHFFLQNSPLFWRSARTGKLQLVREILQYILKWTDFVTPTNLRYYIGNAVVYACEGGQLPVVQLLLEYDPDVICPEDKKDDLPCFGREALKAATALGHRHIVNWLLETDVRQVATKVAFTLVRDGLEHVERLLWLTDGDITVENHVILRTAVKTTPFYDTSNTPRWRNALRQIIQFYLDDPDMARSVCEPPTPEATEVLRALLRHGLDPGIFPAATTAHWPADKRRLLELARLPWNHYANIVERMAPTLPTDLVRRAVRWAVGPSP